MEALIRYLPILQWLPAYRRRSLLPDLIAGATVAVMLVPQAMAYALLAGLPPVVGLYAALVPPAVYVLFGTSRQLAVGPVAIDSLLVAGGIGAMAAPNTAEAVVLAGLLMFMVGALQIGMGLLRLGRLSTLLTRPVLRGFTAGAALIIATSQLKHVLGVALPRGNPLVVWGEAISRVGEVHGLTLSLGLGALALLLVLRQVARRFPGSLAVVVLGVGVVTWFGLDAVGVAVVGPVPAGLPALSPPDLSPTFAATAALTLLPTAMVIALVSFLEGFSVASVFAQAPKERIDADQEMVALGMANLTGSFFGGYPVAGGLSRTAVNADAGARSGLASLVTAVLVALALLGLTPMFTHLPIAALAAIILVAVTRLVQVAEIRDIWRTSRREFFVLGLTFATTVGLGVVQGILAGIAASLATDWVARRLAARR